MIFDKPLLTKANIAYFCFALIFGTILAFGIASITYQPVPLQVKEDVYAPAAPSAVPTQAPQLVPGSSADLQKDVIPDQFAPAAPPVIVTTMPLPTITTVPTVEQKTTVSRSCSYDPSAANASVMQTTCILESSIIDMMRMMVWMWPLIMLAMMLWLGVDRLVDPGRLYTIFIFTAVAFFYFIGWF